MVFRHFVSRVVGKEVEGCIKAYPAKKERLKAEKIIQLYNDKEPLLILF